MGRAARFLRAGAYLTLTALLTRTVGMLFSVYLSSNLHEAGMGLFSLILSVYGLAVTLSSAGIHLTATRLVAEALGRGSPREARAAAWLCARFALVCGLVAGGLLFCLARPIGTALLGDARTVPALRILALGLPFLAVGSALHGYLNGVRRLALSAAAHLLEQAVRITVTVVLVSRLAPLGLTYACVGVVTGTCVSEAASCLLAWLAVRRDQQRYLNQTGTVSPHLTRTMLGMTLPLALSALLRTGLTTIEHIAIPRGLQKSGKSGEDALAAYGALSGMAFPLLLYPQALIGSFAGLLVPEVAECKAAGKHQTVENIATVSLRYALLFSFGITAIFATLPAVLGEVLYHSNSAATYLRILAPLVPIMYLDGVADSLLKGLGEHLYTMRVNILDAALSVSMVILLLPRYGVAGYLLTVWVCETVNFACSAARLVRICPLHLHWWRDLFAPLLAAIGASAMGRLLLALLPAAHSHTALLLCIVMIATCFLLLLPLLGAVRFTHIKLVKKHRKRG